MQPLNPFTIPLQGQVLIEASAGTGKTYTIALLFLRLLLEKKLSVDQILIVTFTKAATEELRARVRLRIREALDCLRGEDTNDETLANLIDTIRPKDRKTAEILLDDGLTRMDEAAIFTIHGFCQRMLQEHAFESGSPFMMEFIETETVLREQIIEDFWRNRFYKADRREAAWVSELWESPQKLLSGLAGHLGKHGVIYIPRVVNGEIKEGQSRLEPIFKKLRLMWQEQGEEVTELLQTNKKISRNNRDGYGKTRLMDAVNQMKQFFASAEMGWLITKPLRLFTSSEINRSLKKTGWGDAPAHPFFDLFDGFLSAHDELVNKKRIAVLSDAVEFLKSELKQRKQVNAQLYFDDLLTELGEAVDREPGQVLSMGISKKYPAILIDEFQDTDPLQYRIFSSIHNNGKACGLFLIGDPKQAVYGFRGADIFTYIKARQDTKPENQFTMTVNYRSTANMVSSVNRLFSCSNPFLFAEIDFSQTTAGGKADETHFTIKNQPVLPLHWLILPEETDKNGRVKMLAKDKAKELASSSSAAKIASLLALGKKGEAMIDGRPLTGGDIAVLVRTHREAENVRKYLQRLGITSVYISRESVFASPEAEHLLTVLSGLHGVSDSSLVCNCLAAELFGYTAHELDQLRGDEIKWAEVIIRLDNYLRIWQKQGILSAFYMLLAGENAVKRLLSMEDGERKLTNYLHLVESLQEISGQLPEPQRLLRRLREEMENRADSNDREQLRLESDENLVKLVTIHKAKGLEYSLVFLPFLWSARACKKDEYFAFHLPEQPEQLLVDLGSKKQHHYELAEKERLAEDLRLLYVALTRAKHSCFICWGRVSKMEESALNYLLHGGVVPAMKQVVVDELELSGGEIIDTGEKGDSQFAGKVEQKRQINLSVPVFNGCINTDWQLHSYSRMTGGGGGSYKAQEPDYDRLHEPPPVEKVEKDNVGAEMHGFPRGAAAGTCIHAIFEHIDFTDSSTHERVIEKQLKLAGYSETLLPFVKNWVKDILNAELMDGFSLSGLDRGERIDEMAFFFPLETVSMDEFNRILTKFSIPVLNPGKNYPEIIHGLMTGFIDLVYRYKGRFFIVDYKSNYLGRKPGDYNRQNLISAVSEHRYDIQYLIYTLALHRYLGSRLVDYNYEQHMGGVQYLFLRGMEPGQAAGAAVFSDYPPPALIRELDRCCGQVPGDR